AKTSDVHALLFGKLEDGPKRVRVRFAHRIIESEIRRGRSSGSGPIPVAAGNRSTVVQRDFRFEHTSSGTQSKNHLPLHSLDSFGITNGASQTRGVSLAVCALMICSKTVVLKTRTHVILRNTRFIKTSRLKSLVRNGISF